MDDGFDFLLDSVGLGRWLVGGWQAFSTPAVSGIFFEMRLHHPHALQTHASERTKTRALARVRRWAPAEVSDNCAVCTRACARAYKTGPRTACVRSVSSCVRGD